MEFLKHEGSEYNMFCQTFIFLFSGNNLVQF